MEELNLPDDQAMALLKQRAKPLDDVFKDFSKLKPTTWKTVRGAIESFERKAAKDRNWEAR